MASLNLELKDETETKIKSMASEYAVAYNWLNRGGELPPDVSAIGAAAILIGMRLEEVAVAFRVPETVVQFDPQLDPGRDKLAEREGNASDDDDDDDDFDDDDLFEPPVLKGKNPISLLFEVARARDLPEPEFSIERSGGDDHVPLFDGAVKIEGHGEVSIKAMRNKADAKKKLAEKYLIERFEARREHTRR